MILSGFVVHAYPQVDVVRGTCNWLTEQGQGYCADDVEVLPLNLIAGHVSWTIKANEAGFSTLTQEQPC